MELNVYLLYLCICVSVINGQQSERPAHCDGIQCYPPDCPDAYLQEGECCPGCPGPGRSCTYQGRTLRDGEKFKQECNTCICNNGNVACTEMACTGSKPGRCPRPDGMGICVERCTNDDSCPRRQKCCSNGCGHTCQRPIRGKRCRYLGGTYRDGESFRDDCNTCVCNDGNVACTRMACLKTCVHNGVTYRDGESYMNECNTCMCSNGQSICTLMACPGRPGSCSKIGSAVGSICIDECTSDYNCPVGEKCCNSGCGRICTKPIGGGDGKTCQHNGVTYKDGETFKDDCNSCVCNNGNAACTLMACPGRPGTCPQISDSVGMICIVECTSDYTCAAGQKCCSNGCGRACTTPISGGMSCIHNGVTYNDGESFNISCNTCTCINGIKSCTLKACPDKPGTCPQVIGGIVDICVDDCTSDYDCLGDEKCCSIGNCKSCKVPIGGGGGGRPCDHKGKTYQDGESFKDECNTCNCNDGIAACTLMACPDRPGTCPTPVGGNTTGICLDECFADNDCRYGEKCCSNGCGRVCMTAIGGGGKPCVHKGKTYQDGESFKDDCNTCNCYDGNAGCTLMACPDRPGTCPTPVGGNVGGVCIDECNADSECPYGEKCCSNGCGRVCMKAIGGGGRPCTHKGKTYQDGESFKDDCNTCNCNDGNAGCTRMACPDRPGTCPTPVGGNAVGICIDECNADSECPYGEKCCSNGCGRVCMKAIGGGGRPCIHKGKTYQDGESFKDDCNTCNCNDGNAGCTRMACPDRPGTCPTPVGGNAVGICLDECNADSECPYGEKCCSNGCGRVCMKAIGGGGRPCVHKGKTYQDGESFKDDCNTCNCNDGNAGCTRMACPDRPGTCPTPVGGNNTGICLDECFADRDCRYGEKCCSNGCGRVCMTAIGGGGRPCIHKGKTYQDGESFKDDCNTCNCNDGIAGCTRMACPDRPGTCPVPVESNSIGVCLDQCYADSECPYVQKCCNTGCGRVCMNAIGGGGRPCIHKGKTYQDGESFKDDCNTCNCNDGIAGCTRMACPDRPGTCPVPVESNSIGVCLDQCYADSECPYVQKCCNTGCGRVCMNAIGGGGRPCIHKGKTYQDGESFKDDCNTCNCNDGIAGCTRMACPDRPGTCPVPVESNSIGVCLDQCYADSECQYGQKCCNTGCGRVCMNAIGGGGRPCIHKGKTYQDGESFKDDCNTCNCNDGFAGCTRMACPDRPGTCPQPRETIGLGACLNECNADSECPYGQKCCSNGCGRVCMNALGGGGQSCVHNGITYQDGETFKDDCNTCRCNNGFAACTRMACPKKPCVYYGITYRDGETFKDQCNDCVCNDGNAACTMKACPEVKPGQCPPEISSGSCVNRCTTDLSCPGREKCCSNGCGTLCLPPTMGGRPCYHNGQTINDGDTFKDDCNTCRCSDGKAACTMMACPKKPCMYNGRLYQDGETFKQDCNTCTCNNGQAACTKMACYDEKVGHCPKPNGTGICIVRCTTDLSCPREQKCCSNGCGTVCMDPVYGGGSCLHNGVVYKDGETFKDDCNSCTCDGGNAVCTKMTCSKDKPGVCPALNNNTAGICVNECNNDERCPGIQKCCSNGCGQVCMRPDVGGQPCHVNGYTFQHGESFKDGCNTCMCRNGKPACTKKACPPILPCYHNGKMYLNGDNFTDECNRCICRDGNVACTFKQCGKTCTHQGKTYQDGEGFKDDCNTCQCNDGRVTCTLLDCSGAKPGTCPRPQLFRPCNDRCVNDKGCQGTKKCCNNWCGYTCMEPVNRDNCQGIICQDMECNLPNTLYTIPGTCCPICRPPLGDKPGSCPRNPRAWLCLDLCSADFHCPGQQKCCSHRCGKSCERPRFDRCEGIQCPPLRCMIQFRPPGRCCPVCRRRREREQN
ncbi:kielin/chordin-like protein isoform X3 [Ruditapes philippinarum]|uniref:kielin/chordin-like protein isoform X3 n=1 Tax=Ruditapes philippinarum TaxID=129788 RepID=UPI00295A7ADF|nr:kielin/chordin-like protein isoform X3 [Ruditapes philippinarum]